MPDGYGGDLTGPVLPPGEAPRTPDHRLNPAAGFKRQPQERRRNPRRPRDEARDHFAELAAAAERAHRRLIAIRSPYRFCIYRDGDEIMIDVVLLGPDGAIRRTLQRRITHDSFLRTIAHIESGEGLFFEQRG